MFAQFRQRSLELERLDTGDYTAEEYEGCIVELQRVNRWLGDASAVRESLLRGDRGTRLELLFRCLMLALVQASC
jgi:hypothetical protein